MLKKNIQGNVLKRISFDKPSPGSPGEGEGTLNFDPEDKNSPDKFPPLNSKYNLPAHDDDPGEDYNDPIKGIGKGSGSGKEAEEPEDSDFYTDMENIIERLYGNKDDKNSGEDRSSFNNPPEAQDAIDQMIQDGVNAAADDMKNKGINAPSSEDLVRQLTGVDIKEGDLNKVFKRVSGFKGATDWKKVLRRVIMMALFGIPEKEIMNFSLRSRRRPDEEQPIMKKVWKGGEASYSEEGTSKIAHLGYPEETGEVKRVVFSFDASGSMTRERYALVFMELENIYRNFQQVFAGMQKVEFIAFYWGGTDSDEYLKAIEEHRILKFRNFNLQSIRAVRNYNFETAPGLGGGTAITHNHKYLFSRFPPASIDLMIVFTDGEDTHYDTPVYSPVKKHFYSLARKGKIIWCIVPDPITGEYKDTYTHTVVPGDKILQLVAKIKYPKGNITGEKDVN